MSAVADQVESEGGSNEEIIEGALAAAEPAPGLRWLDIGCGTGDLLRRVHDAWAPAELTGVDLIDWPDDELRSQVTFIEAGAEDVEGLPEADRVMLVEVIEHVPAPWLALSRAARLVAPGGRIVVSTPNIATLRSRLELAVRGNLTSFRPHFTPALPHVTARVLEAEGLRVEPPRYAGADVISLTGGRVWPPSVCRRYPRLTSISVIVAAERPL